MEFLGDVHVLSRSPVNPWTNTMSTAGTNGFTNVLIPCGKNVDRSEASEVSSPFELIDRAWFSRRPKTDDISAGWRPM